MPNWANAFAQGKRSARGRRVLLCDLVGTLERRKVEATCRYPSSSASELHNLRRALDVLKNKKSIPLCYIYADGDLHNGNQETVLGLLKSIKYAYRALTPRQYGFSF